MKVYGVIKLAVSMNIDTYVDGLLAANYKLNDLNTVLDILHIQDTSGNLHRLNVHAIEINWEDVFDE